MRLDISDVRKLGKSELVCTTIDGRCWTYAVRFNCDDPRFRVIKAIDDVGSIDPTYAAQHRAAAAASCRRAPAMVADQRYVTRHEDGAIVGFTVLSVEGGLVRVEFENGARNAFSLTSPLHMASLPLAA